MTCSQYEQTMTRNLLCVWGDLRSEAGGLPQRTDQQRSGDGSKKKIKNTIHVGYNVYVQCKV